MNSSYDNTVNERLKQDLRNIMVPSDAYFQAMQQALSGRSNLVYMVRPGDTLESIAQRVKIPAIKLMQLNNISNPHLIYPGQILKLTNKPKERKEKKVSEKKTTLTLEDYENVPGYFIRMRETGHYSPSKRWKWEIYSGHGDNVKFVCEDYSSSESDCLLSAEQKLRHLLKPYRIKQPNRFLHTIFL